MFSTAGKTKIYTILTSLILGGVYLLTPIEAVHAGIGAFFYDSIVIGFFGWILGMTGVVLNYAINTFVIGFSTNFMGTGVNALVDSIWATIRDIFNLTFIFGLVYIGFKMILRTEDGNSRRWLINIILAALLVNFSLFISKFIIDFSNIVAVEIINLGASQSINGNVIFPIVAGSNEVRLTETMQSLTAIQTSADTRGGADQKVDPDFSVIFGTMMIFIVASFVYLSAAIMLIIRAAVLVILMMMSPLLFIGMVLPSLKSFSSKLWKMLLSRSFVAPVYLLMLYLALSVAGTFIQQTGQGDFAQSFAGNALVDGGAQTAANAANAFGPFILVIILLMMSLIAAQKMGAEGANRAVGMANSMRRSTQKYVGTRAKRVAAASTVGVAGAAARNTVGRGASALASSRTFQKFAAGNVVARQALKGTRKVADTSFDPRKSTRGGFDTRTKAREKREDEFFNSLDDADMTNPKNLAKAKEREKEIKSEATEDQTTTARKQTQMEELRGADKSEISASIKNLNKVISDLKEQKNEAPKEEKSAIQKEIKRTIALRNQAKDIKAAGGNERKLEEMNQALALEKKNIDDRVNNADKIAEAEVKFANKLKYLADREWNMGGAQIPLVSNRQRRQSVKSLKRKHGGNAQEMASKSIKKQAWREKIETENEMRKEDGVDEPAPEPTPTPDPTPDATT